MLFGLAICMFAIALPIIIINWSDEGEKYVPMNDYPSVEINPSADSAHDTLSRLQIDIEETNRELTEAQKNNQALLNRMETDKETIKQLKENVDDSRLQQEELNKNLSQMLIELQNLKNKQFNPETKRENNRSNGFDDIPIGLGYENLDKGSVHTKSNTSGQWIKPLDRIEELDKDGNSFTRLLKRTKNTAQKTLITDSPSATPTPIPIFTVPKTAIGLDAKALTAIIGRIPNQGKLTDPYPSKFIIGKQVLMANGHNTRNLSGAIIEGIARGDKTLRCVSVDIKTINFIFNDGRMVLHEAKGEERLGWVGDPYGWCITGELISNAPASFIRRTLSNIVGTAGEALADSQTTSTTGALGDQTTSVTGNQMQYILGKVTRETSNDISDRLLELSEDTFEAIVVKPNKKVVIHFDETLEINYDSNQRLVHYIHAKDTEYELD